MTKTAILVIFAVILAVLAVGLHRCASSDQGMHDVPSRGAVL